MKRQSINALLIFLISLLIYLSVEVVITTRYYLESKKAVIMLRNKVAELKTENTNLKNEIANSSSEAFIEKEARERLMLAKKGETIIYFTFKPTEEKPQTTKEKENFFKNILHNLLKLFGK